MEELELMTAIIESNPGISVEDAWKMYSELVTRVHKLNSHLKLGESAPRAEDVNGEQASEEAKPPRARGYTRRSLKVKPEDSVTKDAIFCCICGKKMSTITSRHLASHEITREDYLKLCGYPSNQALMSLDYLAKMKAHVLEAQKARAKKSTKADKEPVRIRKSKKAATA